MVDRQELFHFSDDPSIGVFHPRPVAVPAQRPWGQEWLNGSVVWAIDDWHQGTYLFPRDCPRIVSWPVATTSEQDFRRFRDETDKRMIAYIETAWLERLTSASLVRYRLPFEGFEPLHDAGKWVARQAVEPVGREILDDLPLHLESAGVDLRPIDDLSVHRKAWDTSLHVSGIRLRNARSWRPT